jgi:hypothetical protein
MSRICGVCNVQRSGVPESDYLPCNYCVARMPIETAHMLARFVGTFNSIEAEIFQFVKQPFPSKTELGNFKDFAVLHVFQLVSYQVKVLTKVKEVLEQEMARRDINQA